jgi:hypothetical protein
MSESPNNRRGSRQLPCPLLSMYIYFDGTDTGSYYRIPSKDIWPCTRPLYDG